MTAPTHIQIDNFLESATNQQMLDFAIEQEANFVDSTTATNADNYRRSKVLHVQDKLLLIIEPKLLLLFDDVLAKLHLEPFEIGKIEAQLTAHNHGCFYKIHSDSGSDPSNRRLLSYVYYFNCLPQAFQGGELEIGVDLVTPVNNRIAFFPSGALHQVLPIECPDPAFKHSRFTINGWISQI